ncbi:hypothetical protein WA026_007088 [Henosepilachna vigintioctopunctata]|uniref:Uncharacterized protein n=1 Tax=Henosepilachna vigintioctopunctata TaxID=420089 RepID=A0AAW1V4W9_9CUCU
MVIVKEQNINDSSSANQVRNEELPQKKLSAKEKRIKKRMEKMRCKSRRINRLAQPRTRVEKFKPKPPMPIILKTPKPLESNLEEKLEELSQPKHRVTKDNEFSYEKVYDTQDGKRKWIWKSKGCFNKDN